MSDADKSHALGERTYAIWRDAMDASSGDRSSALAMMFGAVCWGAIATGMPRDEALGHLGATYDALARAIQTKAQAVQ